MTEPCEDVRSTQELPVIEPAAPVTAKTKAAKTKAARKRTHSRRGVLGAALSGGAAVAGIRLLVVDHPGALPALAGRVQDDFRPPRKDWTQANRAAAQPSSQPTVVTVIQEQQAPAPAAPARAALMPESQRISQLLRRTTFGYTAEELDRALSDGFDRTVERLLNSAPGAPPAFPNAEAADSQIDLGALRKWWVNHMVSSPTPFAERMTLFWHGHFTSDWQKVGTDNPFLYWQNQTWRQMSLDRLGPMLMKVTVDPAMLVYLDLDGSVGDSPNENYSRELMELFTMGAGNFKEADVKAGARALAGWRIPQPGDNSRTGIFQADSAFTDALTFLGQSGNFDTQRVINTILGHPATAGFVVGKMVRDFVTGAPDAGFVNRLAASFRASGYDVKQLMREILLSDEFSVPGTYRSLVKSPLEMMVHALKALRAPQLVDLVVDSASGIGQALFDPPSVQGWPTNAAWISSNTVMARVNFIRSLLDSMDQVPSAAGAVDRHFEGIIGPGTAAALNSQTNDAGRWWVLLASPEFQLK